MKMYIQDIIEVAVRATLEKAGVHAAVLSEHDVSHYNEQGLQSLDEHEPRRFSQRLAEEIFKAERQQEGQKVCFLSALVCLPDSEELEDTGALDEILKHINDGRRLGYDANEIESYQYAVSTFKD